MRIVLILAVCALSACEAPRRTLAPTAQNPAETPTGISITGSARIGVAGRL